MIDDIDRNIVAVLRTDGRATYAEVGLAVGLSAPAAKRRVDRLRARGAVRGFTVVLDPAALGWATEAFVEVHYSGTVSPTRLQADFAAVPEIVGAWTISGDADAVLRVLTRDVAHLERTIQRIRAMPEVSSTRTDIVLSTLIDRTP